MRRWKGYTAKSLDNKPSSKIMRQMHAQAATEYILNMEDVELPASFDPPTDTRFKFWAYGKSEHLARTEAEGGIGACHRVTVSKKQNIQSEIPVHLNLKYTIPYLLILTGLISGHIRRENLRQEKAQRVGQDPRGSPRDHA
jgi:hypothetical protein